MPLNARNQRTFHRTLYSGILQSITLLKRDDNQQQGTVRSIKLHQCRQTMQYREGETLLRGMNVGNRCEWCLPRIELDRVGVAYINPLDRIVDSKGRYWQPEADNLITIKLFEVHVHLACKRVDPPTPAAKDA